MTLQGHRSVLILASAVESAYRNSYW